MRVAVFLFLLAALHHGTAAGREPDREQDVLDEISKLPERERQWVSSIRRQSRAGKFRFYEANAEEQKVVRKHWRLVETPGLVKELLDESKKDKAANEFVKNVGWAGKPGEKDARVRYALLPPAERITVNQAGEKFKAAGGYCGLDDTWKDVVNTYPGLFPGA